MGSDQVQRDERQLLLDQVDLAAVREPGELSGGGRPLAAQRQLAQALRRHALRPPFRLAAVRSASCSRESPPPLRHPGNRLGCARAAHLLVGGQNRLDRGNHRPATAAASQKAHLRSSARQRRGVPAGSLSQQKAAQQQRQRQQQQRWVPGRCGPHMAVNMMVKILM